jgi:hypothetical protein
MSFLSLFNTTGWIFGPAILLAGVVALVLCIRASLPGSAPQSRRVALFAALLPFALGICAAIVGFAVWQAAGAPAGDGFGPWPALGKACLAGLVVTVPPLGWAFLLNR